MVKVNKPETPYEAGRRLAQQNAGAANDYLTKLGQGSKAAGSYSLKSELKKIPKSQWKEVASGYADESLNKGNYGAAATAYMVAGNGIKAHEIVVGAMSRDLLEPAAAAKIFGSLAKRSTRSYGDKRVAAKMENLYIDELVSRFAKMGKHAEKIGDLNRATELYAGAGTLLPKTPEYEKTRSEIMDKLVDVGVGAATKGDNETAYKALNTVNSFSADPNTPLSEKIKTLRDILEKKKEK